LIATQGQGGVKMFSVYEVMGFKFETTKEGLVYCLNLSDMYDKYGKETCEEVVKLCHLYNDAVKLEK
jgi:hypothetical protein